MGDENSNLQQDVKHLSEVIRGFKSMFSDSESTSVIDEQQRRIAQLTNQVTELTARSLLD